MNEIDTKNMPACRPKYILESLCQEFDGNSFYGLEYIIEDVFLTKKTEPSNSVSPSIDWFGLYD
jgi:hypothetical protein